MSETLEIVCGATSFLAIYHYALYPAAIMLLARLKELEPGPKTDAGRRPSVALIIAAFNEERIIHEKISNALSLDYPPSSYRVIVIADGSSDATVDISKSVDDPRLTVLYESERRGKANALNRAIEFTDADIIVLSDANNFYSRDAIELLVERLQKPRVGGVTGVKRVTQDVDRLASKGDSLYWIYESIIKTAESSVGGTVTGDGEIFALHRSLFHAIPNNIVNDDMFITFELVKQGYRVEYEPRAVALEAGSMTMREDFNVKVRMIAGGYQGVKYHWRVALVSGWFSVRFVSHKILRWTMPFLLIALFISSAFLTAPLFCILFAAQLIFYVSAGIGAVLQKLTVKAGHFYIPFYFVIMNAAATMGLFRFIAGQHSPLWVKARR
jgi:biofilm PGA synthesis N-glycosyltransferase PgaC